MDKLLSVPALTSLDLRGNELEEGTLAQMAQRLLSYDEAGCAQLRYFASDEWSLREGQCWLDLSISASAALDLTPADLFMLGGLLRRNTDLRGLITRGGCR